MKTFTTALASVMGRPSWLPVPALALRLLLGQQADVVLHGQHVVPNRLLGSNFTFAFPSLRKALGHLLSVR
jgi:NAD dependent epimerase/dehydratase family enzyme